jgi:cellulose synthase/poly-beta-1,6-N-acetylglucosamine synthase-like glycosyltransferase
MEPDMWTDLLIILSGILLILLLFPVGYWLHLAIGALRSAPLLDVHGRSPSTRFLIVIPAHDEASVIGATVNRLQTIDYPSHLFSIHIIADHCSDHTAAAARRAGATVHERNEGPRSGKGAALSWLFQRILKNEQCDAVVIFDADTRVDADFLRVMDFRLAKGEQVIQGQHVIRNPYQGWYPALVWAMFLIDNRFQNLGRANLGWSAKNMGDSICFRVDILRELGWGEGLTEDYHLRLKLLLMGIRIGYEPAAIGYGEAPLTWARAQAQRTRWLRGTHDASQQYAKRLLVEGIRKRKLALLDGAVQASFPSYSTLSLMCLISLGIQVSINYFITQVFPWALIGAWTLMVMVLLIYPLVGLALERAPVRAYIAILLGPYFILWRTWLAFVSRFGRKQVTWIRTEHGESD